MKRIALTGGMGMGKSTVAQMLEADGIPVVDSDVLAREVVLPGQPVLVELQTAFGGQIVSREGTLCRDALARIVFSDPAARKRLEAILHPRIRERWQATLQKWENEGRALAVAVIPLLYETGAEDFFDAVIAVGCTAATQLTRLRARSWSDAQVNERLAAQLPAAEKMARADYVIWTEGSPDNAREQLTRIMRSL